MKYLFFLSIIFSCKSEQKKAIIADNGQNTAAQKLVKRDTTLFDMHNPYQTGKDTIYLNKIMDKIFKFPEVEAINKQIDRTSNGKHGVSIMVHNEFNGDTSYYHFMVGDNSHKDRYIKIYDFLVDKKTGQIKVYESSLDTIISLQDWRGIRK